MANHTDEALLDDELDESVYLLDNEKEDELLDDGDHDRLNEQVNNKDDTEQLDYDVASDTMEDDVLDLGISDEDCLEDSVSESTTKFQSFNQRFTKTIKRSIGKTVVKVVKEEVKPETVSPSKSKLADSEKQQRSLVESKKESVKKTHIPIENKISIKDKIIKVPVEDIPCSVSSSHDIEIVKSESVENTKSSSAENVFEKRNEQREDKNNGTRERFKTERSKTERSTKLSLNNLGKQTWEHVPKSLDEVIVDAGTSSKNLKGKRPWDSQRGSYDLNIKIAKDHDGSRTIFKESVEQYSGNANSIQTTVMTQPTSTQEPMYQELPEVTSAEQWIPLKPETDHSAIADVITENRPLLQVHHHNPILHPQSTFSHISRHPILIHPPRPNTMAPSMQANVQNISINRQVNPFPQPNLSIGLIHPQPRPTFSRTMYQLPPNGYQPSRLPQNQSNVRPLMTPTLQQPQARFASFVRPMRPGVFNRNSLQPGLMNQFRQPMVHQNSMAQYPPVEGHRTFFNPILPPTQTSYSSPLPRITPPYQQATSMIPQLGEYQDKQSQYNKTSNGNILVIEPTMTGHSSLNHMAGADKKNAVSEERSRISQKRPNDDSSDRWNSKYSRNYDREEADMREYRRKIENQKRMGEEFLREKEQKRLTRIRPQTEEENKQAAEEFLNRINGRRNNNNNRKAEEAKIQVRNNNTAPTNNTNAFLAKLEAEKGYAADKTIKRTINQNTTKTITRTVTNDNVKSSNNSVITKPPQPKQEEIHRLYKVKYKNGDIVYKTMPVLTSSELEKAKKDLGDKSKLAPNPAGIIRRRIVVSDNTVTPQTAKVVDKTAINNIDLSESVRRVAGALAASSRKVSLAERFTNIKVSVSTVEEGSNQVKKI